MNGLLRLVVCGIFLVACPVSALADSVSVSGFVNFDQSYATFSSPFSTGTNSQYFAPFSDTSVQYFLGTIPYMVGVLGGVQETFSITAKNGDVLAYYNEVNTPSQSYDSNGNLVVTLDESGFYTMNGGQQRAGFFNLTLNGTSPTGAASNVSFTGIGGLDVPTPIATDMAPEPASIMLMGTGFLCVAMLLRSRHRRGLVRAA